MNGKTEQMILRYKFNSIILAFLVFFCYFGIAPSQSKCKKYRNGCCPGFQLNIEIGKCTECKAGYSGIACARQCVYPNYGLQCKQKCNCLNDSCDFAIGCLEISTSSFSQLESSTVYLENWTQLSGNSRTKTGKEKSILQHYLPIILLIISSFVIIVFIAYGSLKLKKCFKTSPTLNEPEEEEDLYNTIQDKDLDSKTKF